jgi:hypothetical protein
MAPIMKIINLQVSYYTDCRARALDGVSLSLSRENWGWSGNPLGKKHHGAGHDAHDRCQAVSKVGR